MDIAKVSTVPGLRVQIMQHLILLKKFNHGNPEEVLGQTGVMWHSELQDFYIGTGSSVY